MTVDWGRKERQSAANEGDETDEETVNEKPGGSEGS